MNEQGNKSIIVFDLDETLVCPVRLCDVGQAKIKELIACDIERRGGGLSPSLLSFRADVQPFAVGLYMSGSHSNTYQNSVVQATIID